MNRFYCPDIAQTLKLTEDESNHCVRVLRLGEGDMIQVVDGKGKCFDCQITFASNKGCSVDIVNVREERPSWGHRIAIAVAPTKHTDRTEWLLEKCTEIGVDRIIPLSCHNGERKQFRSERLRKIMVSAMKQSLKATLPQLDELTPIAGFLNEPNNGQRFIAYCDPTLPCDERVDLAKAYTPGSDVTILIGPEGDFSQEEINQAKAVGYIPVTFGASRLRTETAAMVACSIIHAIDASASK
ncbi:MAG: 16S rRNA (uracil(1498)-N(3))-methyltransferase [Muribaculaceae bacterium]|nr:16S rRNA (uracil(1498)-N(3))-methyltransferase [Muribaculaceae bacterium]